MARVEVTMRGNEGWNWASTRAVALAVLIAATGCSSDTSDTATGGVKPSTGGSGGQGDSGSGAGNGGSGGSAAGSGGQGGAQAGSAAAGAGAGGAAGAAGGTSASCDAASNDQANCACVSVGETRACYVGEASLAGVGACLRGSQTCVSGGSGELANATWGACTGSVAPGVEACGDSVDNDCDGQVDESCACKPGQTQSCYSGPSATAGVGACHAGTQACAGDGSSWGACAGEQTPASGEVCGNGVDDDCNGQVDEGCFTCAASKLTFALPVGTSGGSACIQQHGGTCVDDVPAATCSGTGCQAVSNHACGSPHCGTLRCNDGSIELPNYCSVVATCGPSGLVATGFTW